MKNSKTLRKLYDAYNEALLTTSTGDGTLYAVLVPGRTCDYVSTDMEGEPIVLLSYGGSSGLQRPPISLQHFTVEFGVRCRVRTNLIVEEGYFVVISLRGANLALKESFCIALDALISSLGPEPTASEIERTVRQFVELMSALALPSSRAIAGLWAELWLILVAEEPEVAAAAWHGSTTDRFDFAFPDRFIEVKATERETRNHDFSFEQLRGSSSPITIVSLKVRRLQSGKSISDLIDALTLVVTPTTRTKLIKNVFNAIGCELSEASEIRFDETFAQENLRFIEANNVPVPVIPEESPISAVRFSVNLDDASIAPYLTKAFASAVITN